MFGETDIRDTVDLFIASIFTLHTLIIWKLHQCFTSCSCYTEVTFLLAQISITARSQTELFPLFHTDYNTWSGLIHFH